VLKVLVSNVCRNDCRYCATRCSADVPRVSFHPEELARVFVEMERRGLVRGLFLSSGIAGTPDDGQALIVDTAHIVRRRYGYRGYLHLKILPGVSEAAVRATVELADRVSVNLEAPNEARLASLAPQKSLERELMPTLRLAIRHAQEAGLPSGVTTQYVAGAAGESDEELLRTSWRLYRELGVKRAYYSAFRPVPSSPLESVAAMPAIREHRLYQADWLLRHYGFEVDELVFESGGLLCLEADPKLVWARAHPESYPVDVATASYWELLRVPGIGPRSAKRLIEARNRAQPRDMKDLAAVGVQTSKARSFILINGRLPDGQMRLPI
jgi:predicted DNA-binding helix-hairpin-helix protein